MYILVVYKNELLVAQESKDPFLLGVFEEAGWWLAKHIASISKHADSVTITIDTDFVVLP